MHELPYSPADDAAELESLAEWAMAFSPLVAADPPGGLLLDIAGVEHLFGGEAALLAKLDAGLRGFGLSPRIAVAPTLGAAWAMARFSALSTVHSPAVHSLHDVLRPLPIAGLRLETSYVAALREVGIERIGQLLDIPRRDLGLRFGPVLLRRLDQALGDVEETLESVRLRETPMVQRIFDGPVVDAETIRRTSRELLDSLLSRLASQGLGVLQVSLEFLRIDAGARSIELQLTHPSASVAHLWSLLSPRLERVSLGFGVEALSLVALRTGRTNAVQSFIWQDVSPESAATTRDEGELLDRLVGRFGAGAVARCALVERYIPEAAFAFHTVREEGEVGAADKVREAGRMGTAVSPAPSKPHSNSKRHKSEMWNRPMAGQGGAGILPANRNGNRPLVRDSHLAPLCPESFPVPGSREEIPGSGVRERILAPANEAWGTGLRPVFSPSNTASPKRPVGDRSPKSSRKSRAIGNREFWNAPRAPLRPMVLFETPEPLRVIALHPDGSPVRIWWRGVELEIRRGIGPERISPPWWSAAQQRALRLLDRHLGGGASGEHASSLVRDSHLAPAPASKEHAYAEYRENMPPGRESMSPGWCDPRDYFLLLDMYGRCLWVYRAIEAGQWYLHGVFS
ncbi:MAG: DNA polymerase Y family protein [Phycisphaerales bacterium]|nr:DNA polymerase Y family protein [Phycisphaerales bacterium]